MTNEKSIKSLPRDILSFLTTQFLDVNSITSLSVADKTFSQFFKSSNCWHMLLHKDFEINPAVLAQVFAKYQKKENLLARHIYGHFYTLKKNQNKLPRFVKAYLADKAHQSLLIKACLDDADFAFQHTACEEHFSSVVLSIYAHCYNISIDFLKQNPDKEKLQAVFMHATKANNLPLLQYLLNSKNQLGFKPDQDMLNYAARAGNLAIVQDLLNSENNFNVKPNLATLNFAALSGNFELLQYFLDLKNQLNFDPDENTLNRAAESGNLLSVKYLLDKFGLHPNKLILSHAVKSGNLELVKYLLDSKNNFGLTPNQTTLYDAALTGNLELVKYLLDPDNKFGLIAHPSILFAAARSGNLQLIQYLINPDNKLGLSLSTRILDWAVQSDNFQLVEFLLDKKFGLTPTLQTLYKAAGSGNFQIMQHLLNEENRFGLSPDQTTLDSAVMSGNHLSVQFLLDPKKKFDLNPNEYTLNLASFTENFGLYEQLLPCHMAIKEALKNLQNEKFEAVEKLLQTAFIACPNHYSIMMKYILENSDFYKLTKIANDHIKRINENILDQPMMQNSTQRVG